MTGAREAKAVPAARIPGQPCFLAGLVTVWMAEKFEDAPNSDSQRESAGSRQTNVQIGIFIDDRTLWLESARNTKHAVRKLQFFVERGDEADRALGWMLHTDRSEWASSVPWRNIPGKVQGRSKCWEGHLQLHSTQKGPADQEP